MEMILNILEAIMRGNHKKEISYNLGNYETII